METAGNFAQLNKVWLDAMQDMFRASMSAMTTFQEELLRMAKVAQQKNMEAWQVSGTMVDEWVASFQRGQQELQKLVEESFQKAQSHLDALKQDDEEKA